MRIALYQPEIAGNVGAILRLGACLGLPVDLIEPLGFAWDDKRVARAGMDYIAHVELRRHADWTTFRAAVPRRLVLLSTRGVTRLPDAQFLADDTLLFGRESGGVPGDIHSTADLTVRVPLRPQVRSLNLAVTAGIVAAEALRQVGGWPG